MPLTFYGGFVRFAATVVVFALVWLFLRERERFTTPAFTAICTVVVIVGVLWLADIERSSRLVVGWLEIDRRLELADDAIARLERLEESAKTTGDALSTVTAQAETAARELRELSERETLRKWAMTTPLGVQAFSPAGTFGATGGLLADLAAKAFTGDNEHPGVGFNWECSGEGMKALEEVRARFPELPYATCAIGVCLRRRGEEDKGRAEIEAAVTQLQKLVAIEPHVRVLDAFVARCGSELAPPGIAR